jgi:predicted AlkP superfamily phosphohydrolase/phosphomutase
MPKSCPRVIVFGIDGGTWDVILPLVRKGQLPCFRQLLEFSSWGKLRSTVPPSSFPAWTTAITGVNPGRHGITDFTRRLPGQDKLIFLNSRHRGVPTVFDILSQRSRKVASLGIPATSPPNPINGISIGGFDCPVAVSAARNMVYPSSLATDLFRKFGDYPYGSISEFRITRDWYAKARDILLRNIKKREKVFHWIWGKENWNLFWMVFPETDTASHHFWALHDPMSPRHDPELAKHFGDTLNEMYKYLDKVLSNFLNLLKYDDALIVMSDHGFGGAGTIDIYLNLWLQQEGYLTFNNGRKNKGGNGDVTQRILKVLPNQLPQWLFRKNPHWMGTLESHRRFAGINWKNTIAFSEESNSFPGIWLRLEGRDPEGTIPLSKRDQILEDISLKLLAWMNLLTNQPVMKQVWRREDILDGPYLPFIPDLVLEPALINGYSPNIANSNRAQSDDPIQNLPRNHYRGGKGIGFSGTHRNQGVFLAYGSDISTGEISEINLVDITPTILDLLGEPVPEWMEGTVLECASRASALIWG